MAFDLQDCRALGAGWNHRIAFGNHEDDITSVYGPRIYGEYKVFKGFSGRLDVETMNTFVPAALSQSDLGQREWVPAILWALKRTTKSTNS